MKYCINYNKTTQLLDKADEINIFYDKIENLDALLSFCQEHISQRINVCITDLEAAINENHLKDLLDFQKEHQDLYIYLRLPGRTEEVDFMFINYPDSKFYFDTLINDWDRVAGLIDYGVTDIFIVDGLGFELDKVAEIAHKYNVQVRVFPNLAQSTWRRLDDLRKFWIRPEDIDYYGQFVDVCEFFGEDKKFDVLYNIYKKDKKWFGNLNEVIDGMNQMLDSRYIVPRFVKKRVRCGRECLKGGNCQMCDRIKELSNNLGKAGLVVTIDQEREDENNG